MKLLNHLFFSILLGIILISCQRNISSVDDIDKDVLTIKISKEDIITSGKTSDYFKISKIIPLETKEQCLIANCYQLVYFEGRIYIMDKGQSSLFVFDNNGKFLLKIGEKEIPGNRISFIGNFFLDKKGKNIYINDAGSKIIYKYSMNGQYIGSIEMENYGGLFGVIPNGNIAITYLGKKYTIDIINSNGKKLKKFIPFDQRFHISSKICPFYQYENSLYFWQDLDDNIYRISQNKCYPARIIDFGENGISRDEYLNKLGLNSDYGERPPAKFMNNINYYIENDEYIFFKFLYEFNERVAYFQVLFNKYKNEKLVFSPAIKNDCLEMEYFPKFYDISDNFFVSYLYSRSFVESNLFKNDNNNYLKDSDAYQTKILKNIKSTDNPIIVLYSKI